MQSEQFQRGLGGLDAVVAGPERQVVQELVGAELQRGPVVVGDGEEVHHHLGVSGFADYAVVDQASVVPVSIEGALYSPFSYVKGLFPTRWFPKITLTIHPPQTIVRAEGPAREARRKAGEDLHRVMQNMTVETRARTTLFSALLDARHGDSSHSSALAEQAAKLADASLTPSAKVLAALREHGNSFPAFGLAQSQRHAAYFRSHAPGAAENAYFDQLATASLDEQAAMEAAPRIPFDDYVAAYRASNLCHSSGECD